MHELSIANNLIDIVCQHLQQEGGGTVKNVKLRIGQLSCVHQQSLRFSFDLVTENTPLQGATLEIVTLPVVVYCAPCQQLQELPGIQKFQCPVCGTPTSDIRQGQELEIESIEVADPTPPKPLGKTS